MQELIKSIFGESIETKKESLRTLIPCIEEASKAMASALKNGNKVMICGNGGSASDSQHFAAELIGRFKKERRSLPAIALTTDTSIITAVGNDYGFEKIFSKQVEGLGTKGDILVGISTSGGSKNVANAMDLAKTMGIKTIALLGCDGGKIGETADISVIVPSKNTPRIQEVHTTIIHIFCEIIEKELF